jgi:hypothetical protein
MNPSIEHLTREEYLFLKSIPDNVLNAIVHDIQSISISGPNTMQVNLKHPVYGERSFTPTQIITELAERN